MAGDADDIAHDGLGVREDGTVDLLMDVADAGAALVVAGGIGFVDVTDFAGFGVEDLAVNLEMSGDFLELGFPIRGHRLSYGFARGHVTRNLVASVNPFMRVKRLHVFRASA